MIIIDTNVLSELMRQKPDQSVLQWLNTQVSNDIAVTAITVAEILYGIIRLSPGKRRSALHEAATTMFAEDFSDQVLPFDEEASHHYAKLVVLREQAGQPISMADAQIAAICLSRNAALATRNSRDFKNLGIKLFNPWVCLNHI